MDLTIYHVSGETKRLPLARAQEQVAADREWSLTPPPPPGWEREIPRYQAREALKPARHERYRHEPPFSQEDEPDRWQYGTREIAAGEIVETTDWPARSFVALNHSAKVIFEAFLLGMRSRMPVSPWKDGRVYLADGLAFGPITAVHTSAGPTPPAKHGPARGARPRVA